MHFRRLRTFGRRLRVVFKRRGSRASSKAESVHSDAEPPTIEQIEVGSPLPEVEKNNEETVYHRGSEEDPGVKSAAGRLLTPKPSPQPCLVEASPRVSGLPQPPLRRLWPIPIFCYKTIPVDAPRLLTAIEAYGSTFASMTTLLCYQAKSIKPSAHLPSEITDIIAGYVLDHNLKTLLPRVEMCYKCQNIDCPRYIHLSREDALRYRTRRREFDQELTATVARARTDAAFRQSLGPRWLEVLIEDHVTRSDLEMGNLKELMLQGCLRNVRTLVKRVELRQHSGFNSSRRLFESHFGVRVALHVERLQPLDWRSADTGGNYTAFLGFRKELMVREDEYSDRYSFAARVMMSNGMGEDISDLDYQSLRKVFRVFGFSDDPPGQLSVSRLRNCEIVANKIDGIQPSFITRIFSRKDQEYQKPAKIYDIEYDVR